MTAVIVLGAMLAGTALWWSTCEPVEDDAAIRRELRNIDPRHIVSTADSYAEMHQPKGPHK